MRRQGWYGRQPLDKAFGIGNVGGEEHLIALLAGGLGQAVVDRSQGHQAQAGVIVLVVVPAEEGPGPGTGVLRGAEAVGEVGPVLEGLEVGLGVGVVVSGIGLLPTSFPTRSQNPPGVTRDPIWDLIDPPPPAE